MNKRHLLNWRTVLASVIVCCLLFVGIYQLRKEDGVRASYNDSEGYTYASEDPLFAATHFHLFAKDRISMEVHTHGNVACKSLNANVDFGTRKTYYGDKKSEEISYARNIERINPNAVAGTFILGSDYEVTSQKNANQTVVSDGKTSHTLNEVASEDIVLEKEDAYVLDLDSEFEKLRKRSKEWAKMKSSDDVVVDITSDQNNRYIDLADVDMEKGVTCVDISYDEWTCVSNPITLKNLDADNSHTGIVVLNIDLKGKRNPNLSLNEMKASVREGNAVNINNNEVAPNEFGSVRVVYNIYDSSEKDYIYDGYVTFGGVVYGSILAPGADLTVGAINGSAIAENIMHSGGESHRNDIVKERAGEEHISDEVKEELSADNTDDNPSINVETSDNDNDNDNDNNDDTNTDGNTPDDDISKETGNNNSNGDGNSGSINVSGTETPDGDEKGNNTDEPQSPNETDKSNSSDDKVTASPADSASDKATEKPANTPDGSKATSKPTEKATTKPEAKDTPKPTQKATDKPTAKDTPKPTQKATDKPAAKDTPKPTQKATPKPTEKATAKPAAKDTPKPASKDTPKPTQKATPKPTEKATDKPAAKDTPKTEKTPDANGFSDKKPTATPNTKTGTSKSTPAPVSESDNKGTASPNETPSANNPDASGDADKPNDGSEPSASGSDDSDAPSDGSDSPDDSQNGDNQTVPSDAKGSDDGGSQTGSKASKSGEEEIGGGSDKDKSKEDTTVVGKTAQSNKSSEDTKTTERVKSKFNAPKTGDDMNFATPICIMVVSFIMFVVLLVRKKSLR